MTTDAIPATVLECIDAVTIDCDHPDRTRRRLYVLQVEALIPDCPYAFYVGSTSKKTRVRLTEHRRGNSSSADIFKNGRAWPAAIRADLTVRIPTPCCKHCAANAEALFALWVNAALGRTKCDRLKQPASANPRPEIRQHPGTVRPSK